MAIGYQRSKLAFPILVALSFMLQFACSRDTASPEEQRQRMVELQIERRGISDKRILDAFRTVPREKFTNPKYRHRAYDDLEAPSKYGESLDRPYENAIMLNALQISPNDKVLEIGTGEGYLASVMSLLAKEVYTIEIVPELAEEAEKNAADLNYTNVHVKAGDGFMGWPEYAPFDAIILRCSPPTIPKPLEEQLAEGGRILLPLGGGEKFQELILFKKKDGKLVEAQRVAPTTFAPMKGKILEERKKN